MRRERTKNYFDFDGCVLDSFDDKGVRRQFKRLTGMAVTEDLRPVIERQLAEGGGSLPDKGQWKSKQASERAAQLFILCVGEFVWMPLMIFLKEAEGAIDEPERLAKLREFKAVVKRNGFWHKRIDELTAWAVTGKSGGHA